MNPEVEMSKHKAFFRLKEGLTLDLWDVCIEHHIKEAGYFAIKELLFKAMNDSYEIGDK